MNFKSIIKEKDYLIKSVIKKLNIYKNHDEFYHLGTIALYNAYVNYDELKDKYKNFDLYAFHYISNYLKTELTKINKYEKIEMKIDLYQNDYLAPIIEDDIVKELEFEDLLKGLTDIQFNIIWLKKRGFTNKEIATQLEFKEDQIKYQMKLIFSKIKHNINKININ